MPTRHITSYLRVRQWSVLVPCLFLPYIHYFQTESKVRPAFRIKGQARLLVDNTIVYVSRNNMTYTLTILGKQYGQ